MPANGVEKLLGEQRFGADAQDVAVAGDIDELLALQRALVQLHLEALPFEQLDAAGVDVFQQDHLDLVQRVRGRALQVR